MHKRKDIVQNTLWEEEHKKEYPLCKCLHCKQEKYRRQLMRREKWLQRRPEREHQQQQKHQRRKTSLHIAMEQSWKARDRWYVQLTDRRCEACGQVKPVSEYEGTCNAYGFFPSSQCSTCQKIMRIHHQLMCSLCLQKVSHRNFLSQYQSYTLRGNGSWLPLCCRNCEATLLALPLLQQRQLIQSCCQPHFPLVRSSTPKSTQRQTTSAMWDVPESQRSAIDGI